MSYSYRCLYVEMCIILCRSMFFFKQKTAYEMRISDWSSDVCSSDLERRSAVAAGVAFTRELVSEPANILYPESFVERCRHLEQLGVKQIGRASCRERVCQYV